MASDPTPPPSPAPLAPAPRKRLQGPSYREFVKLVATLKRARSYLEIGVHNGSTLAMISCASIAVDPKFVFNRNPMGDKPSLFLYQLTSDEYFEKHDPTAVFGGAVDLIFLDGLHLFEYLLRDFINAERVSGPDSIIMLDDCLPLNVEMTEREHRPDQRLDRQIAGWWTGDVWKVVDVLREYRPDLHILPVDVTPTGSVVVTNLNPQSTVLKDAYADILVRHMTRQMTAEELDQHWVTNAPVPVPEAVKRLFPHVQVNRVGPPG